MALTLSLFLLFAFTAASVWGADPYTLLGSFNTPNPSFVQVFPTGEGDEDALWITSFSSAKPGRVRFIQNISAAVLNGVADMVIEDVQGTFTWPNLISYIPPNTIAGTPEAVAVVPDGFLVPGKSTGGLYVLTKSIEKGLIVISKNITLIAPKTGWFFHMVEWIDLDLDGLLDVVTARAKSNTFSGTFDGELVWLKQPTNCGLCGPWEATVLASGPDFIFTTASLLSDSPNLLQLYAAQFFSSKVVLYEILRGPKPSVRNTVLIAEVPYPEDIHILDLDLDGTLDLLFNEHVGGSGGNVTSSPIPADYLNGEYNLKTLATGFPVTESGLNQAAPGFVTPFFVNEKDGFSDATRPSILVAGDGSQAAYVMTPYTDANKETSYTLDEIIKVDGVIGIIAASYLSPQRYTDFFVPDFDEDVVYVYTYQP